MVRHPRSHARRATAGALVLGALAVPGPPASPTGTAFVPGSNLESHLGSNLAHAQPKPAPPKGLAKSHDVRAQAGPPKPTAGKPPGYAQTLARELAALGLSPRCDTDPDGAYRCHYLARSSLTRRDLPAVATYDTRSRTVYLYVPRILTAPSGATGTPALLQRLMELNWDLLTPKFEWNADSGEVRLSAVLHTDSNFDRRSLRSLVIALDTALARYREELVHLQTSQIHDP